MAISIKVNGNSGSEGFLLAPSGGQDFSAPVALKTTDGTTVTATLVVVAPADVTVQLSKTDIKIGPTSITVKITAKSASKRAGDITLQVKVAGRVKASCTLTSIKNARLRFTGRFQARFATDNDFFNHPRGTNKGSTWALEGEPDFVPPTNNVPIKPGMAVGRVVRFQDAVAPRTHVAPIGVKVIAVEGTVANKTLSFATGDPIIGEICNLGPDTYLAANEPQPPGPKAFEHHSPGFEPMENFAFSVGSRFTGKSAELTDRPLANGFFQLTSQELTKYGVVPLAQFNNQRKQLLLTDYHNLSPADRTGTVAGRNIATRIGHLGGSPADGIPATNGTLPPGWSGKEVYNGTVNAGVQVIAGNSVVMTYFKGFDSFMFSGTLLNFHSDELCGQVDGTLQPFTALLSRQQE